MEVTTLVIWGKTGEGLQYKRGLHPKEILRWGRNRETPKASVTKLNPPKAMYYFKNWRRKKAGQKGKSILLKEAIEANTCNSCPTSFQVIGSRPSKALFCRIWHHSSLLHSSSFTNRGLHVDESRDNINFWAISFQSLIVVASLGTRGVKKISSRHQEAPLRNLPCQPRSHSGSSSEHASSRPWYSLWGPCCSCFRRSTGRPGSPCAQVAMS